MAIAFMQEFAPTGDRSTANYDAINEQLSVDGTWPEGCLIHTAGFAEDGTFRIFDVWETREQKDRFMSERLMPLIEKLLADRPDLGPPSREQTYELHDLSSRDSGS